MSTKHTPGPWKHHAPNQINRRHYIADSSRYEVAVIVGHAGFDEVQANARLIAAAPELLDALRNLVAVQPNLMANSAEIADARAAIAKAVQS